MTWSTVFLPARFIAYLSVPIDSCWFSRLVGHAVLNVLVSPDSRGAPTRFRRRAAHGQIQPRHAEVTASCGFGRVMSSFCPHLAKLEATIKGIDCQDSFQALILEMLPCNFGLD